MAIDRSAGTEIIRIIKLNVVDDTWQPLIFGVQHHIYTVLSIIVHAVLPDTDGNFIRCRIEGWDALGGTSAFSTYIFQQDMQRYETFVWNDKFSMNGTEPTGLSGGIWAGDDAAKRAYQDALADQGGTVAQILKIGAENADDNFDVTCTYIDQNNA